MHDCFASLLIAVATYCYAAEPQLPVYRVATFSADVTVPLGHGMMGGAWLSKRIGDPLEAHGLVLLGPGKPVVFVAVDWCEIRNEAFERWQQVLAAAAGTDPERVMVCAVHQHDAPVADLAAERILRERKATGNRLRSGVSRSRGAARGQGAARVAVLGARRVTHLGLGAAAGGTHRVQPPLPSAGRLGALRPDEQHARPGRARRSGEPDRSLAEDAELLGRRHAARRSQRLCGAPHELLRPGRGFGGFPRPGPAPAPAGAARREADLLHRLRGQRYRRQVQRRAPPPTAPRSRDRLRQAMVEAWDATRRVPLTNAGFPRRTRPPRTARRPGLHRGGPGTDRIRHQPARSSNASRRWA